MTLQRQFYKTMGRDRFKVVEESPHFLTCTIVKWFPVFADPATAEIVLDSLNFLQEKGRIILYGYVIMENHLHLVAASPELTNEIGYFKSFTAKKIINHLKEKKHGTLLDLLHEYKASFKKDRPYQLWQEGSHPEAIISPAVMRQKLEYIHYNPVKRGYVDDPVHWRYSSARNYAGEEGLLQLDGMDMW